jgi:C4-dicarboxylate-specific signal transduction histidine kinase
MTQLDQNGLEASPSELRKQVTELVEQQAAVAEVLHAIACSPHDLQPIFDAILANATHLCRAKTGGLVLFEEPGVRLVAHKGPIPRYFAERYGLVCPIPPGSPLARVVESRSPIHIADLAADDQRNPYTVALVEEVGARSYLLVPMLKEHELIGAVAIARDEVQPFTHSQINLITAFAAQATIALEITRRERQLREVQTELARANRIATMGQLSSSIAHEVNQPITGLIASSQAALKWLSHGSAKLAEAQTAIERVIRDGNQTAEIIGRIRDLIKKAPPKKDLFDMNEAIRDVIILTRGEAVKNGVSVQTQLADGLPLVEGDRVEVQQVILNLIINAIQAMSGVDARRDLHVSAVNIASEGTLVAVRDSGSGLSKDHLDRLFEPFYTTKPEGLGMGLPICRSIIEAHGGRLWASPNEPRGAVFQFTLPLYRTD